MKKIFVFISLLLLCCGGSSKPTRLNPSGFFFGFDLSFTPQVESAGGAFLSGGKRAPIMYIARDNGANIVRLRIWNNPTNGFCDLSNTLRMARRAREAGLSILLDFHYSDTWADPEHQTKPVTWNRLEQSGLEDAVRQYSFDVISALALQRTLPHTVQIGNEVTGGMLWDNGKVRGNGTESWTNFCRLIRAGYEGTTNAAAGYGQPKIMTHISESSNTNTITWFFDNLTSQFTNFDFIGLSYYPWWHGKDPGHFGRVLAYTSKKYNRKVVVVETAYPWTLGWADNRNNIVGTSDQLIPEYPATEAGQKAFLAALVQTVRSLPDDMGGVLSIGHQNTSPMWPAVPPGKIWPFLISGGTFWTDGLPSGWSSPSRALRRYP